jgi:hypothetical protein
VRVLSPKAENPKNKRWSKTTLPNLIIAGKSMPLILKLLVICGFMNHFIKCAFVKFLGIKTAEMLAHSSIDTFPLKGDPSILQSDIRQSVSNTISILIYYWPELKNSAQKVPPQSEAGQRQKSISSYCFMIATST